MNACPNYNSPEWKLLEQKAGSYDAAFDVFIKNNNETPSIEEINKLYSKKEVINTTPEAIKKQLGELPFFRITKSGEVFLKSKNVYPQAVSAIAAINRKVQGLVRFSKVSKATNGYKVVVTEGQQPLFDLSTIKKNNLLLEGFKSFYQQKEAVDVISSNILAYYRDNKDKKPNFKEAIIILKSQLEELQKNSPKEIYQTLINNFDKLTLQASEKLKSLNLISKPKLEGTTLESTTEIIEDQDETIEGSEEIGSSIDNEWTFKYDSKDNALQQVKKFLAFTPKTIYKPETGEFKLIQSIIPNQPSFISYDEVYEQLKAILAGIDNTWKAVEQELLLHEKSKPFINTLLKRINNYKEDKEQLKRQFVSTMSSSYSGFKTIIIKDKIDQQSGLIIGQYFNIIDTNQSSIEKSIISKWQGNFKRSILFDKEQGIINQDKVDQYQDRIKEAQKNPTINNIRNLLEDIGIDLSENSLDKLVNGIVNKLTIKQQFTSDSGLFKLINLRLGVKEIKQDEDQNNELDQEIANDPNTNNSAIKQLAKLESYNTEHYYSNTFKDGEGNTVYSYTFNKFLTKEFNKLLEDKNYVKDLLDITFNKSILDENQNPIYNTWLNQLDTNPLFKQIFNISPLDTLKVGRDGTKLTSMSDLDLEITQVALIQNSGRRKKGFGEENKQGTRIINYLLTVPDKTTSYVIQGTGIDIKLFFEENGTYKIDKQTKNALYSIVASEHNRILSQQARRSENKAYNSGSNKFFFFPTLNELIFNEDKTVKLPTDKINDKTVEEIIKEEINKVITKDISEKIQNWKDLEVIKNNQLVLVDNNYYNKVLAQQTNKESDRITLAAADYIIQSILAKFNTTQTFIDDPAVYFKKDIKTTWDNVGKRLTNLIAPFKEGLIDENNKYFLSVKLDDRVASALNHAQLEARLSKYYQDQNINLPYNDIKGTDAQEYTTLTEKLKVLYSFGEISTNLYNKLLNKIKEQGDNLLLNKEELDKLVFIADKPVYSSRIISREDDTIYREYIKSSSLPLLPQFTKGLEIDKLRKSMESLEKKSSKSVRVAFNTATKLGGKQSLNIWTESGKIKDNLDLESYAITLDRSNFGIQQEVPYDETKDETVRSTQVLKLLFDSIDKNIKGFRLDQKIYNGEELKKIYINLQKELYEKGLSSIEKRLIKNNQLDKPELINILRNEGIKRGYSPAQLSFLELNLENTDFSLPFWSHTNNDKEQSMLTSIWTNKVLKQKMPGGSYVLVSEEGMQGKSIDIVYTKSYDSYIGLKPMRVVYKKDKIQLEQEEYNNLSSKEKEEYKEIVKPAQVLISWNLRDKNGKLLDRNNYITRDEEGNIFIDTTKVPKDILNQFGFRIPNQGHNSMSLIEIVGFLPDIYQGVVIASRNFVTQMGSDFDIDKLYIYNYYLDVDKEGNIHKQDDLKNKLVDIHKSVLFNKEIFNQVVKPLDLGRISYETNDKKLKGIAEDLKKQEEKLTINYLNPNFSKSKYLQSVDGKAMVGITSVANTFNTLLQEKNISLQKQVIIENRKELIPDYITFSINNKEVKLSDISSAYSISGRRKNELHQAIQSAAVDNGNNPLLSYINANPQTSSVLTLMIDLGLEEEEIYGLLSQPVIKEYVERVKASKSNLNESIREEDILINLIEEYNQDTLINKLKIARLEEFPLSKEHFNQVLFNSKKATDLTNEEIQTLSLAKFNQLKQYGDKLQRVANLLNIESKGVGKSLLELADRRRSIDKIFNITSFSNLHNLLGEFDQGVLTPNTISGYGLVNSIYSADDITKNSNLMPYGLNSFNNITEQYENLIGRDATTDNKYEIWKAIKAYQFAKFFTQKERNRIFFDSKENESLNTRINNLLKTKLKNNQFILRLDLSQIDLSGKNPSYVFYNSSKEADIEEINTYQNFYELIFNQDQEIRSIGQDLVKYFYLNGGSPNSKDWGRYISSEMLEDIGLSEFIKTINFNNEETYGNKEEISDVLFQLFQHKPYLTTKLVSSQFTQKKELIFINKDNIPKELVYNLGVKSVFNLNNNLYKLDGRDDLGNYIYKQIQKLGKKFYNEYYSEPIKENQDTFKQKVEPNTIKENPTYQNPLFLDQFKGLLNVTIEEALSNISSTKYNKEISKLFEKVKGLIGDIKIEGVESDEYYFGRWDKKTIKINLKELKNKGKLNKEIVESTILKEIVHVLNTRLFDSTFTPTPEQIQAKSSINTLYNSIRERILTGELTQWNKADFIKFEEILTKWREKKQVSPSEKDFLFENKAKYYGLTNVEDFLHDALLQDEFRELLNQVQYNSDKSLLDRISDLIKNILDGFRELVGINKNSALEEAFTQLIKLTKTSTNQQITNNEEDDQVFYDLSEKKIKKEEENNYQEIINDYKTRLNRISQDISKAYNSKNKELEASLTIRIQEVLKEQQDLIADNTLETLIKHANNDFTYIEKILKKPEVTENDLEYSSLALGTWANIDDIDIYKVLTSFDDRLNTPKATLIKEIAVKARELKRKVRNAKIEIGINLVNKTLNKNISREDLTLNSDISVWNANTRDISTSNNVILSTVDKLVRDQDFYYYTDLTKIVQKADELNEKLDKIGINTRDKFEETFVQINSKGEISGDLVSPLNYNYYNIRKQLKDNIDIAPNPQAKKEANEKYYNWIKENHIIVDHNKLYKEDENGLYQYQPNENYLKAISKELKEDFEKVIKEAKEKIQLYNEELTIQININKGNENEVQNIEKWKLENNPSVYLDNLINGLTIRRLGGNVIKNNGWKYLAKRANKEHEDEKYNKIQQDETLKEYYDWWVNTMKDLKSYLPYNIKKELSKNDIPSISKDLLEDLYDSGISKFRSLIWSKLLENLSVQKIESSKLINPATRSFEKEFTFQYLNNLSPEDKSYDLTKVLKLFASQTIGYKYKAQIEDQVRLMQSILDESLEQQIKSNGEIIFDKLGRTTTTKGLTNLKNQLEYYINAAFYGHKKDTQEGKTSKEFITPVDKEKLNEEIEEIEKLDITEESKKNKIQQATEKHKRVYSFSAIVDSLLGYTQLKGMGWNIFGGVNNVTFGQLANYNWAASGKDFNDKELNKAIGIVLKNDKKLEALMIKYNVVGQVRELVHEATTNYNKTRKGFKKLAPYEIFAKGEYFVRAQVLVAMLEHEGIYEKYNDKGEIEEDKDWSEFGDKTLAFKFKLDNVLKGIHGNYDPNAVIKANEKAFNRALIQFRRWIPEGVSQRFEKERYNEALQRNVKGRYRTYYDLGWKKSIQTLLKLAITRGGDTAFKNLGLEGDRLEIVKENMKKNLREIYFKLSMMGMYLILSGVSGDDDSEFKRRGRNLAINTVLRLQDDIEFYYSPKAFDNITRSALPVANLIKDFENFSSAFIDTIEGNGTYKSGTHSGDQKLLWKTAKILPFGSAVTSLINKGENQESFRK